MSKTLKIISLNLIFMSTMMCLESNSWWSYWLMLELNSLGFIIYLITKKMENTMAFFLFQNLASITMLVMIFFLSWSQEQNLNKNFSLTMIMAILLKIGMFPFHSWMEKMVNNFPWNSLMILLTWQKLIPLIILSKNLNHFNMPLLMIPLIFFMSMLILKMSSSKKMIFFSSMIHNGWVIMPLKMMKLISFFYLLMYSIVTIPLALMFKKIFSKTIFVMSTNKNKLENFIMMMSMAGIPPTTGFFMKMLVLMVLLKYNSSKFIIISMFLSSCASFYIYFNIFLKNFKSMKKINKKNMKNESKPTNMVKMFLLTPLMIT